VVGLRKLLDETISEMIEYQRVRDEAAFERWEIHEAAIDAQVRAARERGETNITFKLHRNEDGILSTEIHTEGGVV
jgi:hypothetical protein